MAISIGDALLKLKIDKGDFDRDMKGIGASLKKHQKAIGIGMIAVGAAITGVATKSVLDFAKMGDEIAKMAKRTGFSTVALSELRHAAELSGASLAGLEKASRTLSGTILDAGYGLESYTRAFDKIGVSYEDLAKMKPEQQFLTVMEALAGVENESERAALATDLFGRAGTQLLPMLSDGAEGLAEMRREAHELGIVFDKEAAVSAEELTDAMTRLQSSIKGAQNSIAEALIPVITPLLDKITEVTKGLGEWIGENETLTKIITGAGGLLMGLGALLLILPKLKAAFITLGHTLKTLLLNPVVALIAALAMLGYGIYSLVKHHTDWNAVVEAANDLNAKLAETEGKVTEEVAESARAYITLREAYGQLTPEEEAHITRLKETLELYEQGQEEVKKYGDMTEEEFWAAAKAIRKTTEEVKRLTEAQRALAGTAFMAYAKIGWKRPLTAFELEQQMAFAQKLGISGFQAGGIISKPTLAMLGEKGPEAVVPLDRMGGYKTANIYVQVDGRTLAQVIGQPLVEEIRIRTGARI